MTYITTKTPQVMMPRHQGKKHDTPTDYAAAWKALAMKEGHKRGVPINHIGTNGQKRYANVYADILAFLAQGVKSTTDVAEKIGSPNRYANDRLRQLERDGKVIRNIHEWRLA